MSILANSNAIETGGYQISRSVRLRSSANGNFTRTPSSATNRRTWTWSAWVKRGLLSSGEQVLFSAGSSYTAQTYFTFYIGSDNKLVTSTGTAEIWRTTQVFRDPSAWYHVVLVVDTTQATADNRTRLYVNGAEVTSFTRGTNLSLNTDYGINYNIIHYIGRDWFQPIYFDGYLTEINFIDGQALTPSSFGQTDPITGSWVAKKYTGSYGTNGFFLTFADNSAATSTTIGKDYSGNGNNWTPNNISVTAGSTYDSMLDVPSGNGYADGGNGRGNYAVLNPLNQNSTGVTLANGNLDVTRSSTSNGQVWSTMGMTSGKWYAEVTAGDITELFIGIANGNMVGANRYLGQDSNTWAYYNNGQKVNSATYTSYGNSYANGDVIGVAFDADTGSLYFYKNGTVQNSGTAAFTGLTSSPYFFACSVESSTTANSWNFGQRPFSYAVPSGYSALNTTNLSDPTVKNGAGYMAATLYAGSSSAQSITNTVNGVSFQPDLVWGKNRSNINSHRLTDSVRGVGKVLFSDSTAGDTTGDGQLASFNSNGWTFTSGAGAGLNESGNNYVAWNWKANGTGVSNTAGSITSTVSANTTSGFSIATTTGTGGTGTIGHGLGAVPQFIMCFRRNTAADHYCYHQAIGNTNFLILNSTAASAASANLWNNTTPTSTVFSVGNTNNNSGDTYVHYIFAPISGYSAFGSYPGNANADGPFVYCGFRPRYVLIKVSSAATYSWNIFDTSRMPYNAADMPLRADTNGAETTYSGHPIDILSNGFKPRTTSGNENASGQTLIYAAFAENPFKYSNAR